MPEAVLASSATGQVVKQATTAQRNLLDMVGMCRLPTPAWTGLLEVLRFAARSHSSGSRRVSRSTSALARTAQQPTNNAALVLATGSRLTASTKISLRSQLTQAGMWMAASSISRSRQAEPGPSTIAPAALGVCSEEANGGGAAPTEASTHEVLAAHSHDIQARWRRLPPETLWSNCASTALIRRCGCLEQTYLLAPANTIPRCWMWRG
mmetsp:Transcript_1124/g.2147  ORF Transcript_1124/g.2147 Transcript_1124/m.2147 type:complete len:209 (-) Transcript_1124:727-1353(-)